MSSITGQASRTECYEPRRVDGSRSLTSHSLRSSSSVIGGMPHGHSTGIYCRGSIRMHQFQQRSVASEVMFGRNLGHLQRRPFGRYGINGYRPRWPLVFAGKRLRRRSRRVLPLDVSRNLSRGAANRKRSHWSTLFARFATPWERAVWVHVCKLENRNYVCLGSNGLAGPFTHRSMLQVIQKDVTRRTRRLSSTEDLPGLQDAYFG